MNYRILFLGYWNLDDGLTEATIFPHLKILRNIPTVEYIHFANTQREKPTKESIYKVNALKVDYSPLNSKNFRFIHFNKVYDFIQFPKLIKKLITKYKINYIVSRGAPAGSLAYLSTRKNRIPFIVESFEPHADYMFYSKTWRKYDPRYIFQKHWENQQLKTATALITVSHNYKNELIKRGVDKNKVFVAPCAVDQTKFYRNSLLKNQVREELNIPESATVGIYVGKFGGIYLEERAFEIFKTCFRLWENFHLVLLSNHNEKWINKILKHYKIPKSKVHYLFVPYDKVNYYLNSADFGFALYKSTDVSPYLSPVKIGEYWACGLPVLMTKNVGDESSFLEKENMGLIYNELEEESLLTIRNFDSKTIQHKVRKIRDFSKITNCYKQLLH